MIKAISNTILLSILVVSSYTYSCDVKHMSVYSYNDDYQLILKDWLGCKKSPHNDEIAEFWKDLGFQKSSWKGRGWEDWCDDTLPLGRTFAAIKLIKSGWDIRVTKLKSKLTTGAYTYVKNNIDNLYFACDPKEIGVDTKNVDINSIKASTDLGIFSNDTTLYNVSVQMGPTDVAANLIHESRHSDLGDDSEHVDCGSGLETCDSSLEQGGAWAYEIAWLINQAYHGNNSYTSHSERVWACINANNLITDMINRKETLACNDDLVDVKDPKPKCPKELKYKNKVISQSATSLYETKTYYSSNLTLKSGTSTQCTYTGEITQITGAIGGGGTSVSTTTKTFPLDDLAKTLNKILPSYTGDDF